MVTQIYSVHDNVAKEYGPIWQARNNGVARRNFKKLMENVPDGNLIEYDLYCLGSVDTDTGIIIPCIMLVSFDVNVEIEEGIENAQ